MWGTVLPPATLFPCDDAGFCHRLGIDLASSESAYQPPRDHEHFFHRDRKKCMYFFRTLGVRDSDLDEMWCGLLEIVVRRSVIERYEPSMGTWKNYLFRVVKNYTISTRGSKLNKGRKQERSFYRLDQKTGKIEPVQAAAPTCIESSVVNKLMLQDFENYLKGFDKDSKRVLLLEDATGDWVKVSDGPSGVFKVLQMGHPMADVADVMGVSQAMATYLRKRLAFLAKEFVGTDS